MSEIRVNDHAELGNNKYVDTECVLYSSGLLVTSVASRSKHWTEGLRARVFTVLYDRQGRALWISHLNACKTCGGRGDWTCPSARSDVFQEQLPEVVALQISGIDVYEYNDEGRDWREQLVSNVKNAIATGEEIYNSVPPDVKAAIMAALA
jgi:hypothetical protein